VDIRWDSPKPLAFRDSQLGTVRLSTQGKFAFQVSRPQMFVNQIVGTQGLYTTENIVSYLQSIVVSRFADLLGELQADLLDLPSKYDELGSGLRASASDDFEAIGLLLKAVYITAINVPEEVEKALDERASIGAIGNMQSYMQFKAARALGDAALTGGGEGGSFTGMGVGLGAGVGLGTAMASAIGQALGAPAGSGAATAAGGLVEGFAGLKQVVAQQLTLSAEEKTAAAAALDNLLMQLSSATSTLDDVKAAREAVTGQFPWLAESVSKLLNTPAALQMLGQITARSM
jgi:membrane protease subunit (stomatin/prohibitin family)